MTRSKDIEDLVRQKRWPEPSPGLRARILSETSLVERPIIWSDRLWYSRAWQWGMAGTAVVLIALSLSSSTATVDRHGESSQSLIDSTVIDESIRGLGFPGHLAASFASRAVAGAEMGSAEGRARVLESLDLAGQQK